MGFHHNMKFDHLEPTKWKKGQSGNPAGAKKGVMSVKNTIRQWLEMKEEIRNPITGEVMKLTQLEILVLSQMRKARAGSVNSFNALLDRLEGKPNQLIQNEIVQKLVARIEPENPVAETTTINIDESGKVESIEYTDQNDDSNDDE